LRTHAVASYNHYIIGHAIETLERIALASESPRRRELLTSLGLHVQVVPSRYTEAPLPGLTPQEMALMHARGKAAGAAPSPELLVAADTVVDLDGIALGKPHDRAESRAMLERLAGRAHHVHTAFVLRDDRSGIQSEHVESTRVQFAPLDPATIAAYVAGGDGLDKAGAYGIQGFAATLVERIDGDYFTVVGFPLAAFARSLAPHGYRLLPTASVYA
jgi:septum formation protein